MDFHALGKPSRDRTARENNLHDQMIGISEGLNR